MFEISTGADSKPLWRTREEIDTSTRRALRFSDGEFGMEAIGRTLTAQAFPNSKRRWLTALALLAFAGACAQEQQPAEEKSAEQLAREIEALAEVKPEVKESELPITLVPLKRADLAQLGPGPRCFLFRGDKIYFASAANHGLLRINGRLTPVLAGGPVGPNGGFFRALDVRVSVGRTGRYAGRAADYVPGWLSEIAVRAHRDGMAQYAMARWTCRT